MSSILSWVRHSSISQRFTGVFRPLTWSLESFASGVRRLKESGLYPCESRFRLRMARYWFAANEIERRREEVRNRPLTIVDLGCERGFVRAFAQAEPKDLWIGLDRNLNRQELLHAGYDQIINCNFGQKLPLQNQSADVVVCLHVMEHLRRPDFLASEIARILRRGGILIAASPVLPGILAKVREWQLRKKIARGERPEGRHRNAFSVSRWKKTVQEVGLDIDALSGAHFFRSDRNPLENMGWWIRLNQFWGGLVPSLGREIFVLSRKADPIPVTTPAPLGRFVFGKWGIASCMGCLFIGAFSLLEFADSHFENLTKAYHDHNDIYYFHPEAASTFKEASLHSTFSHEDPIETIVRKDRQMGKDSHFIIRGDLLDDLSANPGSHSLGIMDQIRIEGREYVLLGTEESDHRVKKLRKKSFNERFSPTSHSPVPWDSA